MLTSTTSAMTSHRILITAEYLNPHFFTVLLFLYVLQLLKALFYANFHKFGSKGWIDRFILRYPVCVLLLLLLYPVCVCVEDYTQWCDHQKAIIYKIIGITIIEAQ